MASTKNSECMRDLGGSWGMAPGKIILLIMQNAANWGILSSGLGGGHGPPALERLMYSTYIGDGPSPHEATTVCFTDVTITGKGTSGDRQWQKLVTQRIWSHLCYCLVLAVHLEALLLTRHDLTGGA